VEVLLVSAAALWLKIAEAIDYLRAVAPRTAVLIGQAVLSAPGQPVHYRLLDSLSPPQTTVRVLDHEDPTTLSPRPRSRSPSTRGWPR
jgi:hypothetical protein